MMAISVEKIMIIIWRDIYNKVDVKKALYDVKCSKILEDELIKLGIEPICGKTGNSYMQVNTYKQDIKFSGEYSGHTIFRDRFLGFEDAIYASLRLIEILANSNKSITELLQGINTYYNTDTLNLKTTEENKFLIIDKVKEYCLKKDYNFDTTDGVKVIFKDGTVLVRASNTSPNVTYRYEANTKEFLEKIKIEFDEVLEEIKNRIGD